FGAGLEVFSVFRFLTGFFATGDALTFGPEAARDGFLAFSAGRALAFGADFFAFGAGRAVAFLAGLAILADFAGAVGRWAGFALPFEAWSFAFNKWSAAP